MPDWRAAIPTEEWEIYQAAGFGKHTGLGRRPAICVIDVQYRTVGDAPLPLRESIATYYKTSCGEAGWQAVAHIQQLLAAARAAGVPIIYPYVAPKSEIDRGRMGEKIPSLMEVPDHGYDFVEITKPEPGDLLIPKRHPSAFFGTALASYLIDMHVDSLILTGCTTSGCIRATAMDAFAYNFCCAVVEECVYDRSQLSHVVNLFDLQAKYADVISLSDALEQCRAPRSARLPEYMQQHGPLQMAEGARAAHYTP
jgi:nicotinamidase-related amidase